MKAVRIEEFGVPEALRTPPRPSRGRTRSSSGFGRKPGRRPCPRPGARATIRATAEKSLECRF